MSSDKVRWLAIAAVLSLAGCGDPDDGIETPADTGTTTDSAKSDTFDSALPPDSTTDSGTDDTAIDSRADTEETTTDSTVDSVADSTSDTKTDAIADTIADSSADTKADVADATDASDVSDASDVADASDAADTFDAGPPYRHTITIDGANDFTASAEKLSTTTAGYDAYVTWDASALYVGYSGADIAAGSASKWVQVYIDVDPGASTGATSAEKYNTQQAALPTGHQADYYFAWKTDSSFSQFKKFVGGTTPWSTVTASGVTVAKTGSFVEMKIPFAALGTTPPSKIGLVTFMLNEVGGGEWTYAGLYSGSFTDGYSVAKAIGYWLSGDFASSGFPNATANRKP